MRVCRYHGSDSEVHVGLVADDRTVLDLKHGGIDYLEAVLESNDPAVELKRIAQTHLPRVPLTEITLLAPVERQEVWAAGVTYLRSKTARMEESDFSASAYDRVYEAERPELFFKSLPEKVVGPGGLVGIRRDARWNVPEPELALVINSRGRIVGHTVGNDMSSRDIEGENLLYLPQAKTYHRSCALGPWIVLGASEEAARQWTIKLEIKRAGEVVFQGETSIRQIKRRFDELVDFLYRSQQFSHGAVLLTGTGIVPDDTFRLKVGDAVSIHVSGIGCLMNTVAEV